MIDGDREVGIPLLCPAGLFPSRAGDGLPNSLTPYRIVLVFEGIHRTKSADIVSECSR
jgi:hypothetical protein